MTTQTAGQPTVEEFLTQVEPEEDDEPQLAGEPLASIAESLRQIAETCTSAKRVEALEVQALEDYLKLQGAYTDLEKLYVRSEETIGAVLAVCSKSKGQLAVKVREVVAGAAQPAGTQEQSAPGDAPELEQPAHDAEVEAWRDFARSRGGVEGDLQQMNRSQIRTALGVAQVE